MNATTIDLSVRLFAEARDRAGEDVIAVRLEPPATVGALRRRLAERYPQLEPLLPHAMFAVSHDYVSDEHPLTSEVEIALILPVSGG